MVSVDEKQACCVRVVPTKDISDGTDGDRIWEPWLLEGMAQTAAVLNGHNELLTGRLSNKAMLVGIRGLQIRRRPRAGETVHYHIELIKRISPLVLIGGSACVGDEEIARGEMKFYVEVP